MTVVIDISGMCLRRQLRKRGFEAREGVRKRPEFVTFFRAIEPDDLVEVLDLEEDLVRQNEDGRDGPFLLILAPQVDFGFVHVDARAGTRATHPQYGSSPCCSAEVAVFRFVQT